MREERNNKIKRSGSQIYCRTAFHQLSTLFHDSWRRRWIVLSVQLAQHSSSFGQPAVVPPHLQQPTASSSTSLQLSSFSNSLQPIVSNVHGSRLLLHALWHRRSTAAARNSSRVPAPIKQSSQFGKEEAETGEHLLRSHCSCPCPTHQHGITFIPAHTSSDFHVLLKFKSIPVGKNSEPGAKCSFFMLS